MSSFYTCPPLPRVPVQGTRVTADTIIDSVVYVHQEVIANIESEMECKILCLVSSSCTFYTYFLATDTLYHLYCFLLTGPRTAPTTHQAAASPWTVRSSRP